MESAAGRCDLEATGRCRDYHSRDVARPSPGSQHRSKGESIVRSSSNGPVFAILGLAIWSSHASAAENDAALRCAAVGDDQARLACYDGIFRSPAGSAVEGARVAGAANQPAVAPAAVAPANPTADFGLTPARKEAIMEAEAKTSSEPTTVKEPPVPDSVTVKVATVAHRLTGELVVITDGGQVWVQIDTEYKGRVKEGDEVTIRKATLGSYFLVTPNHILVRVRRIK
jgi:hypothetical protein